MTRTRSWMCLRGILSDRRRKGNTSGGDDDAEVSLGRRGHSLFSDVEKKCLTVDAVAAFFSHRHISEKVVSAQKKVAQGRNSASPAILWEEHSALDQLSVSLLPF